jgi:hypothetical protein
MRVPVARPHVGRYGPQTRTAAGSPRPAQSWRHPSQAAAPSVGKITATTTAICRRPDPPAGSCDAYPVAVGPPTKQHTSATGSGTFPVTTSSCPRARNAWRPYSGNPRRSRRCDGGRPGHRDGVLWPILPPSPRPCTYRARPSSSTTPPDRRAKRTQTHRGADASAPVRCSPRPQAAHRRYRTALSGSCGPSCWPEFDLVGSLTVGDLGNRLMQECR